MSLYDIYQKSDKLKNYSHENIYNNLIKTYSKKRVDFIMYDLFGYDHKTLKEIEKRNDDKFRKEVKERYNNECIITGTDFPCQVCHIIPFNECTEREKYDVNNGIILRDDLHTLFDQKELKINPKTLRIELSDNIMKNKKRIEYHKYNGIKVNIDKKSYVYLKRIY